ncbi:DUF294 nucleotidyltransferase-like domain-containing protein [Ornithinimicrobium avium]|uniref:Cyclic nucleotide-binding/CBS domain-containing protein n=1 Tax=Ornithinimicrobium avium TaxID=2283195 RepID=A0A345NR13_9MICO|nr:DUF294 nucleotidyltransferase-like domain-containing protein [Ornithinimicrobium avium]AXH97471.1 cyclic nucleotide-binding/CBS domain-containing protein [Ornithinimicrobium avium]
MDVELAEVRDFLAAHPPFDALPPEVLDALPARCTMRYARRGSSVMRAGMSSDRLYVVRSGAVDITDAGQLVDRVGEGGSFGMSAILERAPARYDVTAREDALLLTVPQAEVERLVAEHPVVAEHFGATHRDRIRRALGELQQSERGSAVFRTSVRDLLREPPVCAPPGTTIAEAARAMADGGTSSLLVMEGDRLVGILTDRDLRRRVLAVGVPSDRPVREVMTPDPVTVRSEALALEVMLEMTGRNIHHLPVLDPQGRVAGLVTITDLVRLERSSPVYLVTDLARQSDVPGVVRLASRIGRVVDQLVTEDATAVDIGRVVGALADAVTVRLLQLAEAELGPPPAPYVWVALGSAAREEQTLGGDQDNALVLADGADLEHPWWGELAERVVSGLQAVGWERCPGEVMATNPRWRLTVGRWRAHFRRWATEPEPDAVLNASIFYDMRAVHGDTALVDGLRAEAVALGSRSDLLLAYMAGHAARMRPPIGFFRSFVLEDAGEHHDTFDIKLGIAAVVQLARVHALRAGSLALGTTERLAAAQGPGQISEESARDLHDAFELMSYLRLRHQAEQVRRGLRPDNHIDPARLGSLDRRHLRDAFQIVRTAQHGLSTRLPPVP